MLHHPLLSELIGDIYEASYHPHHWPIVIEKICRVTGSTSGALVIKDNSIGEANGFYIHGLSTELLDTYSRLGHLDPAYSIMSQVAMGTPAMIQTPERHALESPEFYQQVRIPYDLGYVAGSSILINDTQHVGLGLQRSFSSTPYEDASLQLLAELTPHMQRALRIHREFIRLRVEKSALSAGLNNMMMGLILLDHLGESVYINPVARDILEHHPAIYLINNDILPVRKEDAIQLRRLIVECLRPSHSAKENRGGMLGIHHEERQYPLAIMVKPVTTSDIANVVDGAPIYAALYLSDPSRSLAITADNLATLYGLSRTEAQIAIALANGKSLEEIANDHERSINTVRSQLKSIFHKTNSNSQSELLRLLLTGLPV